MLRSKDMLFCLHELCVVGNDILLKVLWMMHKVLKLLQLMVVVTRHLMTLARRTSMKSAPVHVLILSTSCFFEDSLVLKNLW